MIFTARYSNVGIKHTPTSYLEILKEKLCNNTLIQVGGMPLGKEFGFLTKNGNLLSRDHLNEKFECCIPVLSYKSLICSQWKESILNKKPDKYEIYDIPHLRKIMNKVIANDIYAFLTYSLQYKILSRFI